MTNRLAPALVMLAACTGGPAIWPGEYKVSGAAPLESSSYIIASDCGSADLAFDLSVMNGSVRVSAAVDGETATIVAGGSGTVELANGELWSYTATGGAVTLDGSEIRGDVELATSAPTSGSGTLSYEFTATRADIDGGSDDCPR